MKTDIQSFYCHSGWADLGGWEQKNPLVSEISHWVWCNYTVRHKKLHPSYWYNNFAKICHIMVIFGNLIACVRHQDCDSRRGLAGRSSSGGVKGGLRAAGLCVVRRWLAVVRGRRVRTERHLSFYFSFNKYTYNTHLIFWNPTLWRRGWDRMVRWIEFVLS